MSRIRALLRFTRRQDGSAIIEFALVVPILFTVVWAIISFGRAYQRMNTLSTSLREGARYAAMQYPSPFSTAVVTQVRAVVANFSTAYGYTVDTSRVTVNSSGTADVHVSVTNYPLFSGLNFLGGLQNITISRDAVFRRER